MDQRILIVTGMTGAGRSTAKNALEDLGWYVIDNLPPGAVRSVVDQVWAAGISRVAVVLDVRTRALFAQIEPMFSELREAGIDSDVVYLEADDDVIVRRQESARRPHPLQGNGRLLEGIAAERRMLAGMRGIADLVINTSHLNPHQLAARVAHVFGGETSGELRAVVMSFGFKNGTPLDADLVTDVRFLPNPHWVPELRPQSGLDEPVRDYVLGQPDARPFLDRLFDLFSVQREGYLREGKRFATIAIGCTGGKHRSTAMSEEFARMLNDAGVPARTVHRDLGLE